MLHTLHLGGSSPLENYLGVAAVACVCPRRMNTFSVRVLISSRRAAMCVMLAMESRLNLTQSACYWPQRSTVFVTCLAGKNQCAYMQHWRASCHASDSALASSLRRLPSQSHAINIAMRTQTSIRRWHNSRRGHACSRIFDSLTSLKTYCLALWTDATFLDREAMSAGWLERNFKRWNCQQRACWYV
jgi:hypothetical protein